MLKSGIFILFALVACYSVGMVGCEDTCVLQDAPKQCGAFCLSAQRPFIDHNTRMQKQLDSQELKLDSIQSKMEALRRELLGNISALKTAMAKMIEMKTATESTSKFGGENSIAYRSDMQKTLNYTKIGERYFYIEKNRYKTWSDARKFCREHGAYLAALQNQWELDVLSSFTDGGIYWLGVNDFGKEAKFGSKASGKMAPFLMGKMSDYTSNLKSNFICQLEKYV